MSNVLDSNNFGLKIYERFPPRYLEDDVSQNFSLKRYLESMADGGFKYIIEDTNRLETLIDSDLIDGKLLPILFEQYGLEVFNGIPEEYLRYLLPKLGEAWSKKGSLSVIEFITSSLSGIKVNTEVEYDEEENPNVDVRFEMDYTIGNYFPDSKQFYRILGNFLPFYCDLTILYSYLFYEEQVVTSKDWQSFLDIKEVKDEQSNLKGVITTLTQKLKSVYVESIQVEESEKTLSNITTKVIHDSSTVGCVDYPIGDILSSLSSETGSFKNGFVKDLYENAILGDLVLGEGVLGEKDFYVDFCSDSIKTKVVSENASITSLTLIDTLSDIGYNEDIKTAMGYDIIKVSGEVKEILYNY